MLAGLANRIQNQHGLGEIEAAFRVSHDAPSVADKASRGFDRAAALFPQAIDRSVLVPTQMGSVTVEGQ